MRIRPAATAAATLASAPRARANDDGPDAWARAARLPLTKLQPPQLPRQHVLRARLGPVRDAVLSNTLTLVCAPSGFGKTTLCAEWHRQLAASGARTAWVSLERDDDEPRRSMLCLLAGLDRACPGVAAAAARTLSEDPLVPPPSLAALVVNAALAADVEIVLFIDDLHHLENRGCLQFISYLLLHAPPNLHLVVTSQTKPLLPLSYLRAHDQMVSVAAEELQLCEAEAVSLLGGVEAMTAVDVAALNAAMEGWVTGLKIAALAVRHNPHALRELGLARHGAHWLAEYLEENVLAHVPAEVRGFLLSCSVLDRLQAELCDAVADRRGSRGVLKWLVDQNLFVESLGDDASWFRLHPIFREFLRGELAREHPDRLGDLHRRASDWYAARALWPEAIRHALEAGDLERAAGWVETAAMPLLERSDIGTVLAWIDRLPDALLADRLALRLAEAWALVLAMRPLAADRLASIDSYLSSRPDSADALRTELLGARSIHAALYDDDSSEALRLASVYLSLNPDADSFTSRAVRNAAAWGHTLAGDHELARAVLRPIPRLEVRHEQLFPTAYRLSVLGLGHRLQGDLAEAERLHRATLERCEARAGRRSASAALAACFLADLLYERDALGEAEALLEDRFDTIDDACFVEGSLLAYRAAARLRHHRGERDAAAALLDRADLVAEERGWSRMLAATTLERVRLGLALARDPFTDFALPPARSVESSSRARTAQLILEARLHRLLATGGERDCLEHVDWLLEAARRDRSRPDQLRFRLLQAVVLDRSGEPGSAQGLIAEALETAAATGHVRTVADTVPEPLLQAFARAPAADRLSREGRALLERLRLAAPTVRLAAARRPARPTIFSVLTAREIDILTLVAQSLSNKEVARRLHLTPETVKWHMKNILMKLRAESRSQAVARAIDLGLMAA